MKTEIKAALVTGIFGVAGAVAAAFVGVNIGKSAEQKSIQNEINEVMGDMVNVIGDRNNVTINDIKELIEDYQKILNQNDSLTAQNVEYFKNLTEANEKMESYEEQSDSRIQELEQQLSAVPDMQFKDIALSIDGDDIAINSTESSVVINNRTYYSDDFIKSIIGENENMSVQDNTMYIGKIIKDKSALTDNWLSEKSGAGFEALVTDGRGITHTNVIEFTNKAYVKYSLNNEYAFFKCNLNIKANEKYDGKGIVVIKADDVEVYKSQDLSKISDIDTGEIAINNCTVLTIEYAVDAPVNCIISNAVVYN